MNEHQIKYDLLKERERWRRLEDYGCFWSSPDNQSGLRLTPTITSGAVFVDLEIQREHSGIPRIAHGGLPYVIIDGLMGWLLMSHLGRIGFTTDSRIEYKGPLKVGGSYRLQASFPLETKIDSNLARIPVEGIAYDLNHPQRPLVVTKSNFFLPTLAQAQSILGVTIEKEDQKFFGGTS